LNLLVSKTELNSSKVSLRSPSASYLLNYLYAHNKPANPLYGSSSNPSNISNTYLGLKVVGRTPSSIPLKTFFLPMIPLSYGNENSVK
jgi:hypothetical protein